MFEKTTVSMTLVGNLSMQISAAESTWTGVMGVQKVIEYIVGTSEASNAERVTTF